MNINEMTDMDLLKRAHILKSLTSSDIDAMHKAKADTLIHEYELELDKRKINRILYNR